MDVQDADLGRCSGRPVTLLRVLAGAFRVLDAARRGREGRSTVVRGNRRRSAAAAGGGSTGSHSASRARRRDTRGGVRASHAGSRDPVPAHSLRSAAAVSRRAGRSQARPPATSSTTRLAPSVVTSCGAIRTTGLRVAPSAEPRQPDRPAPRRQPAATPGRARSSAPRPRGRRGTGPPGGRQAQRVFGNFIFGHSRQTGKCSVTFVCP